MNLPPHNLEAEQACLGSCLLDPDAFWRVSEVLAGPGDFYREGHCTIYAAIGNLVRGRQGVDMVTVGESLRRAGKLEEAGGMAYLDGLQEAVGSSANVASYARIVRRAAVERAIIRLGWQLAALPADEVFRDQPDDALRSRAAALVGEALRDVGAEGPRWESELLEELRDRLRDGTMERGVVHSGLRDLDHLLNGFRPEELVIIAGRPSMGKTALALQLLRHVALTVGPVLVFSLEMSAAELMPRTVRLARESPELTVAAVEAVMRRSAPVIYDTARTIDEVLMKVHRVRFDHADLAAVFLDHMAYLLTTRTPGEQVIEYGAICRAAKRAAKSHGLPFVFLQQLSRASEHRQDKRPTLADLRGSGEIEQEADKVLLLHRPGYYSKGSSDTLCEVDIAKNRNGPTGRVDLRWDRCTTRFQLLAREADPEPEERPRERRIYRGDDLYAGATAALGGEV